MNVLKGGLTAIAVLLLLLPIAIAIPTVPEVKVNGNIYQTGDSVVVERGDDLNIVVKLQANSTERNLQVEADIVGYEHSRTEPVSDTSETFDLDAGDTFFAKLHLKVPVRTDRDLYDLRVRVASRTGTAFEGLYRLHVRGTRHDIDIRDVVFSPSEKVMAGRSLLTVVRLRNLGERDEDGIKLTVSVPELRLSASDFIDQLDKDESTSSEELFIRIPQCAKEGRYDVKVLVEFNDGEDQTTSTKSIFVEADPACGELPTAKPAEEKTAISYTAVPQTVKAGGSEVPYSVTVTNPSGTGRTYVLTVATPEWANARISPSNILTVAGQSSESATVYLSAKQSATSGARDVAVSVKDIEGNVLKELFLKANVAKESAAGSVIPGVSIDYRRALEIAVVALVVVIVIIGVVLALRQQKVEKGERSEGGKEYY